MNINKFLKQESIRFFLVLFISIVITGCSSDNGVGPDDGNGNNPPTGRGALVSSEFIGTYSTTSLQFLLDLYSMDLPVDLTYNVDAYKIVYLTLDANGTEVEASGAIFIPSGASSPPLLSYQHGTQPERNIVASVDPMNTVEAVIAASAGYLCCAPDYLGLGVSTMLHPYLIENASAGAVIDCIRAAKNYFTDNGISTNGQLFLTGYSEGGYVTMAAHKGIEENYPGEFNITASAPMSGSYDLIGTADEILISGTYGNPTFPTFLLLAYNDTYNWNRLDEIFQSPYNSLVTGLFDGTNSTGYIDDQLPSDINQLLTASFLTNYSNGTDTQFISALENNSLLDWAPSAPMRLFHGDADDTVPYVNALTAYTELSNNGATSISLVTIPGGNHYTSIGPAINGMIEWFETFRTAVNFANAF
ncbi:alpha/beta hydrolase family protein [Bacteroidota bacterium]